MKVSESACGSPICFRHKGTPINRLYFVSVKSFSFLQPFSHLVFRNRAKLLIVNDLGHVDELGKLALQILGDQELEMFRREAGELLCQSVENDRIIAPLLGKRTDDSQRFRDDILRFLPAEFSFQRAPLIDFLDRVSEVDGRVDEQILIDADLSLVGIDHAEIRAFKRAQADPYEVDRRGLDSIARSSKPSEFFA